MKIIKCTAKCVAILYIHLYEPYNQSIELSKNFRINKDYKEINIYKYQVYLNVVFKLSAD